MAYGSYGETARNGFDWLTRRDAEMLVAMRRWRAPRRIPWLDRVMIALTRAGNPSSWFVHGLLLFSVAEIAGTESRQLLLLLAAAALVATAVAQVLKRVCQRPRPDVGIHGFEAIVENPDVFSFPSGHSTVAFAVATALASADLRIGSAELALAAAIAASRVYLGAHYPLDVVVGALLGIVCGMGVALGLAAN